MALSPSHRFGQVIGEVLEAAVAPLLAKFAAQHGLYLDRRGVRPCRSGVKCSWKDLNGNEHDLDYVLERGGTPHQRGQPVAFVETAWRRYTKHSRNKAQEIQGAIVPLAETYQDVGPFMGAILAGVFTDGALTQLSSLGFTVLYFPYPIIVKVFLKFGVDAAFDERTPDANFESKFAAYTKLAKQDRIALAQELLKANRAGVKSFMASLAAAVTRQIERIIVLPLHGTLRELPDVEAAIRFIEGYAEGKAASGFERYEIQVRYSNGDTIEGKFANKRDAVQFLLRFRPVQPAGIPGTRDQSPGRGPRRRRASGGPRPPRV